MTKRQIKTLAKKSFIRNDLDPKKVKLFISKMKRRELKEYLREIKALDLKNKIRILVPNIQNFDRKDILPLIKNYRGKKIVFEEDPSLMVGIKLIDNDLIYDFNLKNSFENLIETYD